jgi:hypothetical protein
VESLRNDPNCKLFLKLTSSPSIPLSQRKLSYEEFIKFLRNLPSEFEVFSLFLLLFIYLFIVFIYLLIYLFIHSFVFIYLFCFVCGVRVSFRCFSSHVFRRLINDCLSINQR